MSTATAHPAPNVEAGGSKPADDTALFRAPANPFARLVAQRRSALMAAVKDEDIAEIGRVLADMAKDGDRPAAKLLFAYVLGKPGAAVEPDRLDIDEWRIFKETAPMAAEMPQLAAAPSSHFPRDIVRMMRPASSRDLSKQMQELLHGRINPSRNGENGKKPSTSPSPNGVSEPPASLDPEACTAALDPAPPSANGASAWQPGMQ
jgi:hypothetical protein